MRPVSSAAHQQHQMFQLGKSDACWFSVEIHSYKPDSKEQCVKKSVQHLTYGYLNALTTLGMLNIHSLSRPHAMMAALVEMSTVITRRSVKCLVFPCSDSNSRHSHPPRLFFLHLQHCSTTNLIVMFYRAHFDRLLRVCKHLDVLSGRRKAAQTITVPCPALTTDP